MPSNPVEMMISKVLGGSGGGSIGTGGSGTGGAGGQANMAEILRQVYTQKFGLNQPIETQFLLFWRRVFTFDFGLSYSYYPSKVSDILMSALPWTLALVIPVPIIGFFIGNRLGSVVALKKTKASSAAYYIFLYLSTMPYYWFAMVLVFVFSSTLGWFPPCRAYSERWMKPVWNVEFIIDVLRHYALPFLSLVSQGIGGWAMGMRASMSSELKSTYVEYSKQLGFSFNRIRKYMQRNAILPNFTWLPMSFAGLISQTLLVEVVFAYPGLGSLMYSAVFSLDYPLLEATFLVTMLIVLIGNFVCDIFYGMLNPVVGSAFVSEGAK
jgi:peptide/nickel transport system permease protein